MHRHMNKLVKPIHVAVYTFIELYIAKNFYSPSIEEIAKNVRYSKRAVIYSVNDLCDKGYLKRSVESRTRNIQVVKPLEHNSSVKPV